MTERQVVPGAPAPGSGETTAMLRAHQVAVGHERQALLPPVSLEIRPGELWSIIGPNGAGKSTWLMTLAGLLTPVSGQIELVPAAGREVRLGYVPQHSTIDAIFPVRVIDVVLSGRQRAGRLLGRYRRDDLAAAERALAESGLEGLAHRQFRDLSGGQRQRVMMARAVAGEANLVLLDEPTAALDAAAERSVLDAIAALPRRQGVAAIMVTHLVQEALTMSSHVLLVDGDHAVCAIGTPAQIQSHPAFARLYRPRLGTPEVTS